MKLNLKSIFCIFAAFFICIGAGTIYAKQDKTIGEKIDQTIDKTAKTSETIKDKAKEFANDVKDKTSDAFERTKNKANELHEKAKEKAHEGIDDL